MKLYPYLIIGLSALALQACADASGSDDSDKSCPCAENQECCAGTCVDLATDRNHCGKCGTVCGEGESCHNKMCSSGSGAISCTPKTCDELNYSCGMIDDECGTLINCGICKKNQKCEQGVCIEQSSTCTPDTCAELNVECGQADNGCGGTLDCGGCDGDLSCQEGKCIDKSTCTPKTCDDLKLSCGSAYNGCGEALDCGTCAENQICQAGTCVKGSSVKDIYPTRKSVKGLQPDGVDVKTIVNSSTHGVVMNMVWRDWQDTQNSDCTGETLYDGNCFTVSANTEKQIKEYTDAGVVVTAIVYGVPEWAVIPDCSSLSGQDPLFCAPADGKEKDFGRFAGFLAHYFNGDNGHGRIADFVIHNEVNNYEYFNPGINSLTSDNLKKQAAAYAKSFNAAYDYIRKEQKQAKVLISLDHFFGKPNSDNGSFASKDLLKELVPKLGDREWRLAYHSYPPNLLEPEFGLNDWKDHDEVITFGTLGILAGWLRQNYPDKPYTWEIQLTENGINGYPSSKQSAQKQYLCQAFKNVLGTPGIESFVYHRLIDNKDETKNGLGCGLWELNKNPKEAWDTYVKVNSKDNASCGFELMPYVEMVRASKNNKHWVTTRQIPSGFTKEHSWKILREKPKEDAVMVYECRVGGASGDHIMISTDVNCETQFNMGPMGYMYKNEQPGTSAVYRCRADEFGTHFISSDKNCEGRKVESLVGYAIKIQ